MIRVQRLPANANGRDFVVGDLHGHYSTLMALLESVHFDPARDRLLSVGDLIDRGPENLQCLDLLDRPWFFAVQGNHEEMLVDSVRSLSSSGGEADPRWETGSPELLFCLKHGGEWQWPLIDGDRGRLMRLAERLARLPHVLVVGEGGSRFHVVHAEMWMPECAVTDAMIDREDFIHPLALAQNLLWSRRMMREGREVPQDPSRLSTVYCGHNVGEAVRAVGAHFCIDTGVFMPWWRGRGFDGAYGLTLVDPATGDRFYRASDDWAGRRPR